jgi:hypothetical protein
MPQLRANTECVVVQRIEDELVLVNLESGIYYTLHGSAAVIFSALDSGCDAENLPALLATLYGEAPGLVTDEINRFVQELVDHSLVVPGAGQCALNTEGLISGPFTPPVLETFEDLQDLLLLDPVRTLSAEDAKP